MHNRIEKISPKVEYLSSTLQYLDLSWNQVRGPDLFSTKITSLNMLEYLNLEGNMITSITGGVRHLKRLRVLRLAQNRLDSLSDLSHLQSLPALENITLHSNPISEVEHFHRYVTYTLRSVRLLDGVEITDEDRVEADRQFDRKAIHTATSHAKEAVLLANEFKDALEEVCTTLATLLLNQICKPKVRGEEPFRLRSIFAKPSVIFDEPVLLLNDVL